MFIDPEMRLQALDEWFSSPQGRHVREAFTAELSHLRGFLYGNRLIQLGYCSDENWLKVLNYHQRWVVTPHLKPEIINSLPASLLHLPLARNSVDCIVAPLTLNSYTRQQNPLDELDRILKPMGHVVFFGINPLSLWGIMLRLGKLACFGEWPAKPMPAFFLKRVMLHRGYVQSSFSNFYYIPPVSKEKWLHKLEILNELGKIIWPCPSVFYCLVMQKQEETPLDLLVERAEETITPQRLTPFQPTC